MKHARIIDARFGEPAFDLPPRFVGLHDRRLGGRVAAAWATQGSSQALPEAGAWRATMADGGANLIWLDCHDDVIALHDVGASVVAAFGLAPGRLGATGDFARALRVAFGRGRTDAAPTTFEGGFARRPGEPATLLTRATVVPLAGEARTATACAVVTWTEMLAPADHDRLRRDLLSALAASPHAGAPVRASAIW